MTTRAKLESAVCAAMESACANVMQWGVDDCALWFAGIVRDALGYDPAEFYRNRYYSRFGAMRLMAANGGLAGMLRAAARKHGWQQIKPEIAQAGDAGLVWALVDDSPVLATAVCRGHGWFVARNETGFTTVPAEDVAYAWSVLDDWQPGSRVNINSQIKGMPQPVYEPVSTVIGLTTLISSVGVSTAVAGAIGGFLVTTTLSIGFSLAASLLQPQKGNGDTGGALSGDSSQVSVQVTSRQSLPYKQVVVGSAFLSGPLFFEKVKPPYLTHGVLINHGKISAVRSITIGNDVLAFSSITPDTILTPLPISGQPNYSTKMRASVRYGESAQDVDPLILARYTNVGANFRQRGIATYVGEYSFGANQAEFTATWGQVARPAPRLYVDGVVVYDPRDNTQILADESTWKWSNNASLVQAWYLTRSFGGRIPVSKIDWTKVCIAADYDDELVGVRSTTRTVDYDAKTVSFVVGSTVTGATSNAAGTVSAISDGGATGTLTLVDVAGTFLDDETITGSGGGSATVNGDPVIVGSGGFIKRYTIDGVIILNEKPYIVLPKLLAANRGYVLESGGKVWVSSSRPLTPTFTINDKIIAGGFKYQSAKAKRDLLNRGQVRIVAENQSYQVVDGPIIDNVAQQAFDGEILVGTLTLDYVRDHRRAQRLLKAYLDSSRLGKTISVPVDANILALAADELIGSVGNVDSDLWPMMNRQYLVTGVGFSDDRSTISMALTEYVAPIETDWIPETDEKDFTLANVNVL